MKLRTVELLVVVAVIGLACISLKQSDPLFETIFSSLTLAFVLASILLAVARNGGARAFWAGFAISSLSYLVFAHVPDGDGMAPRHNGPEVTTQLLRLALNWLHGDTYDSNFTAGKGGYFSVGDDPFASRIDDDGSSTTPTNGDIPQIAAEPFPANLELIVGGGQRVVADGRSMSFMRIGHAAWALLLGWIGGHLAIDLRTVSPRQGYSRLTVESL